MTRIGTNGTTTDTWAAAYAAMETAVTSTNPGEETSGEASPSELDDAAEQLANAYANLPRPTRELYADASFAELRERLERRLDAATEPLRAVASHGRRDVDSSAVRSKSYPTEAAAQAAFRRDVAQLLDVNHWSDLSGFENADFALYDANGQPSSAHEARVGQFVRIDVPLPAPHFWVRIESVERTPDRVTLCVRPSYDPTERPLHPERTAHFFTEDATNTFILERRGRHVIGRVEGRDEYANTTSPAIDGLDAALNRIAAEGAWGLQRELPLFGRTNGLQQNQWNRFLDNLVRGR